MSTPDAYIADFFARKLAEKRSPKPAAPKRLPNHSHGRARIVFGSIEACIDGDARYTTTVEVALDTYTGSAVVTRTEYAPSSGRDSYGVGSCAARHEESVPVSDRPIMAAIKRAFDDTIRRYGKPTKRFVWGCPRGRSLAGLNLKGCRWAIYEAMDRADGGSGCC